MVKRTGAIAMVGFAFLAACAPIDVAPELEAAIALDITGPALVSFATATVTVQGPVSRSVTGAPGETLRITGLPPGSYTVSVQGFSGGTVVWSDQTTVTVTTGATAKATVAASYTLTVVGTGTGTGTVTSSPSGLTCAITVGVASGTCSASFGSGLPVTLISTGTSGTFNGWTGACTGTGVCTVTMSAAQNVTAAFTAPTNTACRANQPILFFDPFDGTTVGSAWTRTTNTWTVANGRLTSAGGTPFQHQDLSYTNTTGLGANWTAEATLPVGEIAGGLAMWTASGFIYFAFEVNPPVAVAQQGTTTTILGGSLNPVAGYITNGANRIAVKKEGPVYTALVNGLQAYAFTDRYINGAGLIGLHAYGRREFDDFKICGP